MAQLRRVKLDLRLKGCWFETHRRHCIVSLGKTNVFILCLVLVRPRKIGNIPNMTEKLLMWRYIIATTQTYLYQNQIHKQLL